MAHLVCPGTPPGLAGLRRFLRQRLPEPLVPSTFAVVDRLPVTANGKVDRSALPDPDATAGRIDGERAYRPPGTTTEAALAGIWGELLGRPRIGMDDDFFELGGHSLLAAQVVARVREQLRRELPLRSLFESPTVAGLARALDSRPAADPAPPPRARLGRVDRSAFQIAAGELDSPIDSPVSKGTRNVT